VRCQAQSSSVKLSQPVLAIFLPLPETATVTHPMSPFTLALNGSVTAVTAPAASAVPVCWSPGFFPQISHQNIFRAMLTPVPPLLGPRRCQCQQLLSTLKLCERQHWVRHSLYYVVKKSPLNPYDLPKMFRTSAVQGRYQDYSGYQRRSNFGRLCRYGDKVGVGSILYLMISPRIRSHMFWKNHTDQYSMRRGESLRFTETFFKRGGGDEVLIDVINLPQLTVAQRNTRIFKAQ